MTANRDEHDDVTWDGANRRQVSPWVVIERIGVVVGAVIALSGLFGFLFVNPFMMAAAGQAIETRVSNIETRFDGFERNQNLQLEVTLQERIERLNVKRDAHPDDPDIIQQRLIAIQACQEVKAKLGRPNTRCF